MDFQPRVLTGWGRNLRSTSSVSAAGTDEELVDQLAAPGASVLARGNGRSYGDAALNGSGSVLDMRSRRRVCRADWELGTVTVEAGLLLTDLLAEAEAHGWTLPVVPGTSQVSVGGAVASDVHGKNHHVEGTFGRYVESMDLITGSGELLTLRPGDAGFAATVGGMGLTGAIVRVTLSLMARGSGRLLVRERRTRDIDAAMAIMECSTSDFSVAWVDLLARRTLGRSVVSEADRLVGGPVSPPSGPRRSRLRLPVALPNRTVNATTVSLFNAFHFHRAPVDGVTTQDTTPFHFPLDTIGDWNRAYGRAGFVQYQFVVPPAEGATLIRILEELRAAGAPGFLAVLKRMGPGRAGLLSFPMEGWSLALDIPAGHPDLRPLARRLDLLVLAAGGRVYLTKDSLLDQETFEAMYPDVVAWRRIRDDLDPHHHVSSDLGRRLGLVGLRQ